MGQMTTPERSGPLREEETGPKDQAQCLPRLVILPELIAKRLDDLIRSDSEMCGAFLDHPKDGSEHAADSSDFLAIAVPHRRERMVVTEEFIGSIDQMNLKLRVSRSFGTALSERLAIVSTIKPSLLNARLESFRPVGWAKIGLAQSRQNDRGWEDGQKEWSLRGRLH